MRRLPLDDLKTQMLYAIIEYWPLQKLFDRIYEITRLPAICFDSSFVTLAYTFPRPFYYCHWDWLADRGHASMETVFGYDYLSYQERMTKSEVAILFNSGITDSYPQACGAITVENHVLAYCGIMQEDSCEEDLLEATNLLIKTCRRLLVNEKKHQVIPPSLILGETTAPSLLLYLSSVGKNEYLYSIIRTKHTQQALFQYILGEMAKMDIGLLGAIDSRSMLNLLYYEIEGKNRREDFLEVLNAFADNHELNVGVSDLFSNPEKIPIYRKQAMFSLEEACESSKRIQFFEDAYCKILCSSAIEYYGQKICDFPEIKVLAEKDAKDNTKLLETLDLWLRNDQRSSVVANLMGVAKGTVTTRLEKISTLIGRDLNIDALNLRLELDIYKMFCSSEKGDIKN